MQFSLPKAYMVKVILGRSRLGLFFFFCFGGHKSFSWGHWYPCFGLLVVSALGFKARVDAFFACFLACVILRFTSGATPADCIEVSMAAKPYRCVCKHWWRLWSGLKPTTIYAASTVLYTILPLRLGCSRMGLAKCLFSSRHLAEVNNRVFP